jgi:D-tyrosyl-tRNA(Tyr) deacylase
VSSIGKGLLVLAAVSKDDVEKDAESMASKILRTKFWDDNKDPPGRVSILAILFYSFTVNAGSGNATFRKLVVRFSVVCIVLYQHYPAAICVYVLCHVKNRAKSRAVSQFTLLASVKKGNKPDFHQSASGEKARALYELFYCKVGELYQPDKVQNGVFGAMMDVALVNDGPVRSR